VGLVPQKIKEKANALKDADIKTYIIAEAVWKAKEVANPDPLVVAYHNNTVYLVGVFDASVEENYAAKEFSIDPKNNKK